MRRRLLVVAALVVSIGSASAQAPASMPGLGLRAPTTASVVQHKPGAVLMAEVRVAAALTPPPGVQQPRALRDWTARLIGTAPGSVSMAHEYRLPVSNVRPTTGSSLDYRVQVPLPAWIAPGSYTLAIGGPGGEAAQPDSVRIVRDDVPAHATRVWIGNGMRLAQPGQAARFFPATTVGIPTQTPAVIGLLTAIAPTLDTARPASRVFVEVEPRAQAGFATTLHARGVPVGATVAWSLSDGTTAYGPPQLEHLFEASGPFHGDLMAIGPDGALTQVHFQVDVEPGVRFGCHSHGSLGSRLAGSNIPPLILALALLKRRPRRSAGISSPP